MDLSIQSLRTKILHDISLTIAPGELVVLMGPSGAGKTTLLRAIAGLTPATEGKIFLGEKNITSLPPYERRVAMLFQNHTLFSHLTVSQNLAFPLKRMGKTKLEIQQKTDAWVQVLDIKPLLQKYPETLSGGERQRVALGQILMLSPQALLLDEPLSHLDVAHQFLLRQEIKKLPSILRIPILYITHDPNEAMSMADRLGILVEGKLLQIDRPSFVYEKPNSLSVARLLGNYPMNFIRGKIENGYFLSPSLPAQPYPQEILEGEGILGLWPEHVHLDSCGFPLSYVRQEEMGAERILYLRLGEETLCCRLAPQDANPEPSFVTVSFDLAKAVFFRNFH